LPNDNGKRLFNFTQSLLGQLFQITRTVAEDTLAIRDLILQRAFAGAQLLGRKPATFIAKALLFFTPALLFVLHILIQLRATAFNFLADLVEGRGNALDFRHIHHANHRSRRRRTRRQGCGGLGLLWRALRLGRLRGALALRLRLPLSLGLPWHEPARLVLRRRHHGESEHSGKDKANHGAIIPG
jgi:hypothetical protein